MRARIVAGILYLLMLTNCSHGEKHTPNPYEDVIPAEAATHVIEIRQMKFVPAELKIHSGDEVTWVNHDILLHDVTQQPDKTWSSGPLEAGASWSTTLTESADYYCSIHVVMKGKIIVE